jgi:hypothetical protein
MLNAAKHLAWLTRCFAAFSMTSAELLTPACTSPPFMRTDMVMFRQSTGLGPISSWGQNSTTKDLERNGCCVDLGVALLYQLLSPSVAAIPPSIVK